MALFGQIKSWYPAWLAPKNPFPFLRSSFHFPRRSAGLSGGRPGLQGVSWGGRGGTEWGRSTRARGDARAPWRGLGTHSWLNAAAFGEAGKQPPPVSPTLGPSEWTCVCVCGGGTPAEGTPGVNPSSVSSALPASRHPDGPQRGLNGRDSRRVGSPPAGSGAALAGKVTGNRVHSQAARMERAFLLSGGSDERPAAHARQPPRPIRWFPASQAEPRVGWQEEAPQEGGIGGHMEAPGPEASGPEGALGGTA